MLRGNDDATLHFAIVLKSRSAFVKLNFGGASLAGKNARQAVASATTSAKIINTLTSSNFKIQASIFDHSILTTTQQTIALLRLHHQQEASLTCCTV